MCSSCVRYFVDTCQTLTCVEEKLSLQCRVLSPHIHRGEAKISTVVLDLSMWTWRFHTITLAGYLASRP